MKKVNGYFIDENNNKWSEKKFTMEEALHLSGTLTDCTNCVNCTNCINCVNSTNCINCTNCFYCIDCIDCNSCTICACCNGFKSNPNRYAKKNLGNKWSNTCIYWTGGKVQVVCGCFSGDLKEFEKVILKKYGHDHEYISYIKQAKMLMEG